jgi:hypothetical protein
MEPSDNGLIHPNYESKYILLPLKKKKKKTNKYLGISRRKSKHRNEQKYR